MSNLQGQLNQISFSSDTKPERRGAEPERRRRPGERSHGNREEVVREGGIGDKEEREERKMNKKGGGERMTGSRWPPFSEERRVGERREKVKWDETAAEQRVQGQTRRESCVMNGRERSEGNGEREAAED